VTFSPDGGQLFLATGGRAIQVFDARPWTPAILAEREALGLIDFLFARPLRQADVIEHLKSSPTISPLARRRALALALVEGYREEADPERYYAASRALLRQPYLNRVQYHIALRQAQTACERAPENGRYQTALGVAQYRTSQYQEALTTLKNRANGTPEVLSFLAMAQHRLGQKEQAQATLEQLRQKMKTPEWASQAEAQGFVREAVALIEGTTPDPKR
jgi:tetratricopeptide (TPR) repeat protein